MDAGLLEALATAKSEGATEVEIVSDSLLLWFHRVGWNERMRSGRTLWDELALHYQPRVRLSDGQNNFYVESKPTGSNLDL